MFSPLRGVLWLIRGIRVYALVGESGTGKSFRAKLVAQKYGIDMIIDDGLLIRCQRTASATRTRQHGQRC